MFYISSKIWLKSNYCWITWYVINLSSLIRKSLLV